MTRESPKNQWRLLVVDDEEDMHQVTRLALKRKRWRNRGFKIDSAHSAKEAEEMFTTALEAGVPYQVALVDVVMETQHAGLGLCEHVRATQPAEVRLVLRTGQPGVAPEERILNDYDIDYYLEKRDVTQEKLYAIVRACLRSSQDISTLLAFGRQLQEFTKALQQISSAKDLNVFMFQGLRFLETKHGVSLEFLPDLASEDTISFSGVRDESMPTIKALQQAARSLHENHNGELKLYPGIELGLGQDSFLMPCAASSDDAAIQGVLHVLMPEMREKTRNLFLADASLFVENWQIAVQAILLKEKVARERIVREELNVERLKSLAVAITGVAHELNTPLGVATTASSVLQELLEGLKEGGDEVSIAETVEDVQSSGELIQKNLTTATNLIKQFRELSAKQHFDIQLTSDLRAILENTAEEFASASSERGLTVTVKELSDSEMMWDGFPGHLRRILSHLVENAIQHAYEPGEQGVIELSARAIDRDGVPSYEITVRDYGCGIPKESHETLFDPFVARWGQAAIDASRTSGAGLGLAVCKTMVVDLLGGSIHLAPEGSTTFVVQVPQVVKGSTSD